MRCGRRAGLDRQDRDHTAFVDRGHCSIRIVMQRFYSPQIDGLRFIAALSVFIHHAPALPGLGTIKLYGWVGVDLFLAISAYLITRLILIEADANGTFSLRRFYIRRALRIWPLYLGFVSAMCVLTLLLNRLPADQVAAWWLSHLSFTGNVMTAINGYGGQPLFTSHLWTVSLEEQAYLILPLALSALVARIVSTRFVVGLTLAVICVLILSRLAFVLADTAHPFIWTLPLRADSFVLGSAAAIAVHRGALVPKRSMMLVGAVLIGSVGLFSSIDEPGSYQIIGYSVIALGSVLLVVGAQGEGMDRSPLAWRPMQYLGKISSAFTSFTCLRSMLHSAARTPLAFPINLRHRWR